MDASWENYYGSGTMSFRDGGDVSDGEAACLARSKGPDGDCLSNGQRTRAGPLAGEAQVLHADDRVSHAFHRHAGAVDADEATLEKLDRLGH